MAQVQYNPPFDGSPPCAGCQHDVRALSALIHNFLNRCDVPAEQVRESKAMVKLYDLRDMPMDFTLTVPHPSSEMIVAAAKALRAATDGMTNVGLTIRWLPETVDKVNACIRQAAEAADAYRLVSDAHFDDQRHSSGNENILRSRQGSEHPGFLRPDRNTGYNYTVTVVDDGGDLVHRPSGVRLEIHDHFKDRLRKDSTFYGKVWDPVSRTLTPITQWDLLIPESV